MILVLYQLMTQRHIFPSKRYMKSNNEQGKGSSRVTSALTLRSDSSNSLVALAHLSQGVLLYKHSEMKNVMNISKRLKKQRKIIKNENQKQMK